MRYLSDVAPVDPAVPRRTLADQTFYEPEVAAQQAGQLRADSSNSFSRAWQQSSIAEDANALAFQSMQQEQAGDVVGAKRTLRDMQNLRIMAGATNPGAHEFTDFLPGVTPGQAGSASLTEFPTYLAQQAGQGLQSTITPLVGGAVGAVAGTLMGGPLGGVAGGALGAFAPSYSMATNEMAGNIVDNPAAMAQPVDERLNVARMTGAASGALDTVTPLRVLGTAALKNLLLQGLKKDLAEDMVKRMSKKELLAAAGVDMAGEAVTEGAQNVVGDVGMQQLDQSHNVDWKAAGNAAAAGFFGTMPLAGGHTAMKAWQQRGGGEEKLPGESTASALVTLQRLLGTGKEWTDEKAQDWADRQGYKEIQESPEFQTLYKKTSKEDSATPEALAGHEQLNREAADAFVKNLFAGHQVDEGGGLVSAGLADGLMGTRYEGIAEAATLYKGSQRTPADVMELKSALRGVKKMSELTAAAHGVHEELGGEEKYSAMSPRMAEAEKLAADKNAADSTDTSLEYKPSGVDIQRVMDYAFKNSGMGAEPDARTRPAAQKAQDGAFQNAKAGIFQLAKNGFTLNGETLTELPKSVVELFRANGSRSAVLDKHEEYQASKFIREVSDRLLEHGMISKEAHRAGMTLASNSEKKIKNDFTLKDGLKEKLTQLGREKILEAGHTVDGFLNTVIAEHKLATERDPAKNRTTLGKNIVGGEDRTVSNREMLKIPHLIEYFGGGEGAKQVWAMLDKRQTQELGGKLKGDPILSQGGANKGTNEFVGEEDTVVHGMDGREMTSAVGVPFNVADEQNYDRMYGSFNGEGQPRKKDGVIHQLEKAHGHAQAIREMGLVEATRQRLTKIAPLGQSVDGEILVDGKPAPSARLHEGKGQMALRKEQEEAITAAEDKLIAKYGKNKNKASREAVLAAIDEQYRVFVRSPNKSENPGAIRKEDVRKNLDDGGFEYTPDNRTAGTASAGTVLLQRKDERNDNFLNAVPYATQVGRLLGHAGMDEQQNVTSKKDVHAVMDKFLSSLAALIEADGKFTGKVGFRETPSGEVKWLDDSYKMGRRAGETSMHQGMDFTHTILAQLPDSLKITGNLTARDLKRASTLEEKPKKWTATFDMGEFARQTMTEMKAEYAETAAKIDELEDDIERTRGAEKARLVKIKHALQKRLTKMDDVMHVADGANNEEPRRQTSNGRHSTGINLEDNPEKGQRLIDFAFGGETGGVEVQPRLDTRVHNVGPDADPKSKTSSEQGRYAIMVANATAAKHQKALVYWLMEHSEKGVPGMMEALKAKIAEIAALAKERNGGKPNQTAVKAALVRIYNAVEFVKDSISSKRGDISAIADRQVAAALKAVNELLGERLYPGVHDRNLIYVKTVPADRASVENDTPAERHIPNGANVRANLAKLLQENLAATEKAVTGLLSPQQARRMFDEAFAKAVRDTNDMTAQIRQALFDAEAEKKGELSAEERVAVIKKTQAEFKSAIPQAGELAAKRGQHTVPERGPDITGDKHTWSTDFTDRELAAMNKKFDGQLPAQKSVLAPAGQAEPANRRIHRTVATPQGDKKFNGFYSGNYEMDRNTFERIMAEKDRDLENPPSHAFSIAPEQDAARVSRTARRRAIKEVLPENSVTDEYSDYAGRPDKESYSEQTPDDISSATEAEKAKMRAEHAKVLGNKIELALEDAGLISKKTGKPISGVHTEALIRVAMNAIDPAGTLRHEHVHQLFAYLRAAGAKNVLDAITKTASNQTMIDKLKVLLADHPAAIAQLTDPEEAVAYMYQFWNARDENGKRLLEVTPQAASLLQRVMKALSRFLVGVSQDTKNMEETARLFQLFSEGAFSEKPDAVAQVLEKKLAGSRLAAEQGFALVKAFENTKVFREAMNSNWQTLKETENPYWKALGRVFHVSEGSKVGEQQAIIDATKQMSSMFRNKMTNAMTKLAAGRKFDNEDFKKEVALGHDYMVKGTDTDKIGHPEVRAFVASYRKLLKELRDYAEVAGVRRLDPETGAWVKMGTWTNNYYHASFDPEYVQKHTAEFRDMMKKHHMKDLEAIVKEAKREQAADQHTSKEAASHVKGEITVENVLDGILAHIVNTDGHPDVGESAAKLGVTPYARAVNKRTLTFLDREAFADFFEKDFINGSTSYIHQMVKRAEYVRQLGNGSEKVQQAVDRAYVYELLGSQKAVNEVEEELAESRKMLKEKFNLSADRQTHHDAVMATLLQKTSAELKVDMAARERRMAELKTEEDTDELHDLMDAENYTIEQELKRREKDGDESRVPNGGKPTLRSLAEARLKGTDEEKKAKVSKAYTSIATPIKAVTALEGTLGREISMNMRNINQAVTSYQHVRLLSTSIFRSIPDIAGIIVRGSDMKHAYDALVRGLKMVAVEWGVGTLHTDRMMKAAIHMGLVDGASSSLNNVGERYGSMYGGSATLRRFNERFFRKNGMEGWNRGMRIGAAGAAMDFITAHLNKPGEHSQRYMADELGLDTKNKEQYFRKEDLLDEDGTVLAHKGELDIDNPAVSQAVMKWVDGAILNPNAAIRPILASDPHYQLAYGLKSFTYAYQNVTLRRVMKEMQHGNYNPLIGMVATTIPLIIVADTMKAALLPGDTPDWMRSIGGVLGHGFTAAPFGGVPQIFTDALPFIGKGHSMGLFGPTAQQLADLATAPFSAGQSVPNELLGSLPFGNVMRKFAPPPPDPDFTKDSLVDTLLPFHDALPMLANSMKHSPVGKGLQAAVRL